MEKKFDKNNIFSLKLSSFNIGILFELEKGNYIINKNKPFDPLLNLSKDIDKIKNNLKSNDQDMLYFLYFNMYNIERILYNKDEIIYFDFDDKNNNYFLKITQEKIEIEKKYGIAFLFYISLLLKYNINVINFSFSFGFINKINSINSSDKNNIKKLLISKIILELINYYNSNQIFEEKNNKEEIENITKDNNKMIENLYNEFEKIGLTINQEDLKLKNIDLIYSKIIIVLLESKDFDLSYKIIEELDLENIYLTKAMLIEISKALFSNENFINKYILTSFDDLFDPNKVNFYYILFKYILKNSIYIYYFDFLNEARKNIIKMIQNQYFSNNNNRTLDNDIKNKVFYILNFFTNSKYYMKYINLNDSNLNSNLNVSNESSQSSYKAFENLSFKKKKETSERQLSNFGQSIEISQNENERKEENQFNQRNQNSQNNQSIQNSQRNQINQSRENNQEIQINQNRLNNEEISNSNPLDGSTFLKRENDNDIDYGKNNDISTGNILKNLDDKEKINFEDIKEHVQLFFKHSSITLHVNNIKKNTIEYGEIKYDDTIGKKYEEFKMPSEKQEQKFEYEGDNKLFENYKKLIEFLEEIKKIADTFLSNIKLLIIIKLNREKGEETKNDDKYINIVSEYNCNNHVLLSKQYDKNILNNSNYEGFISFSKEIFEYYRNKSINPKFPISSVPIEGENKGTSIYNMTKGFIGSNNIIFFKKIIGKHKGIAKKIRELNNGSFISDGYNEIFTYNKDFEQIEKCPYANYYSFFIERSTDKKVDDVIIISQKNRFSLLNSDSNSYIKTEYSCRNFFVLNNSNYIVCDKKEVYVSTINIKGSIDGFNKKFDLYKKAYRGGIKINIDNVAITSNRILSNGENRLKIYNSPSKMFLEEKIEAKNYSFILSENNCAIIKIPKQEKNILLLCACKKYIKDDKNGILLLQLHLEKDNNNKIFEKFYDTKNFEVYCFCPISEIKNKYVLDKNDEPQINETEYFFVGGFDLDKKEGLIKLYKVIYDDEIEKIEIEYILDIIIEKKNGKEDSKCFKGFKGPISCIIQSSSLGEILVTCYDGNIYLFTEPNFDFLNQDYNIGLIFNI